MKRNITMSMLAILAETSVSTVSRALNSSGYVNPKTKENIIQLAKQHKYQINRSAKNLRKKDKLSVGIIIDAYRRITSEVTNPFLFQLLNVASVELELLGVETILFNLVDQSDEYFLKLSQNHGLDGLVVLSSGDLQEKIFRIANNLEIPCVIWGEAYEEGRFSSSVSSNNTLGGKMAANYLIHKNRKNILIAGDLGNPEVIVKKDSFIAQLESLVDSRININVLNINSCDFSKQFKKIQSKMKEYSDFPDGIFACNDSIAMAFIACIKRTTGQYCEKKTSIIGYGDIAQTQYYDPPITTIKQNPVEGGRKIARQILKVIDDNGEPVKSEHLPVKLIIRKT